MKTVKKIMFLFIAALCMCTTPAFAAFSPAIHADTTCQFALFPINGTQQFEHIGKTSMSYVLDITSDIMDYGSDIAAGTSYLSNNTSVNISQSSSSADVTVTSVTRNGSPHAEVYAWDTDDFHHYTYNYLQVNIHESFFPSLSAVKRKEVIAHEFGHCVGLNHFDSANNLMHTNVANMSSTPITTGVINGVALCTHNHTHTNASFTQYSDSSSTQHKARCSTCKTYILQSHTYGSWSYDSSSQHVRYCNKCDHANYASHTKKSSYEQYTSTKHQKKCSGCGYRMETQNHSFGYWAWYDNSQHRRKCGTCGYYAYASHTMQAHGSNSYQCSGCGHIMYFGAPKPTPDPVITAAGPVQTFTDEMGNVLQYKVTNGGITIVGAQTLTETVEIPSNIADLPVVRIGTDAFRGQIGVSQWILPESVLYLQAGAFADLPTGTISIPYSVVSIDPTTFASCKATLLIDEANPCFTQDAAQRQEAEPIRSLFADLY